MHNFTVPAVLKSWIDYVVRPGFTFRLAPGWPGMLENKKVRLIVVSRGSYIPGEPSEAASACIGATSFFVVSGRFTYDCGKRTSKCQRAAIP